MATANSTARRSLLAAIAAIPALLAGVASAMPQIRARNAQEPRAAPAGPIAPGTRCKAFVTRYWHQTLDVDDAPAWLEDSAPDFILVTVVRGPVDFDGKPCADGHWYFIDSPLIRESAARHGLRGGTLASKGSLQPI